MARKGGRFCITTRDMEIGCNIDKLSCKDKALLYHYFVLGMPKSSLKWIHKQGFIEIQRRLHSIIRGLNQ